MSYDSKGENGELGAIYAADESGGLMKILPDAQWDENAQRCVSSGFGDG
jgi:hypothetical protein